MGKIQLFSIQKRIVFIVLVAFLLVSSSIAFAFWDQTSATFEENQVTLGEGAVLEVTKTVNPTETLVPYGSFKGSNDIDEYTFSYYVRFNKEGRLQVRVLEDSIRIGDGDHAFNELVHIQVYINDKPLDLENDFELITTFTDFNTETELYELEVFVRVFVKGPSSPEDYLDAYQIVAKNVITFSVQFNALEIE